MLLKGIYTLFWHVYNPMNPSLPTYDRLIPPLPDFGHQIEIDILLGRQAI